MIFIKRSSKNPVLLPDREHFWEAEAAFNGCPVKDGKTIHFLYRAVSSYHYHTEAGIQMQNSTIGYAVTRDGVTFKNRRQLFVGTEAWEKFGCEDPRVTKLDDTFYVFYTALSAYPPRPEGIRVAVALTKDFETITERHLVTPFNAKAMALFPERINGKFVAILTVNTDLPPAKIAIATFDHQEEIWSEVYWQKWYASLDDHVVPIQRDINDHIEVGAPPLKTKYGWLFFHSYIRNYFSSDRTFGIEAAVLDLNDPRRIVGRTNSPILVPDDEYELFGKIPNIVFPSGALIDKGKVYLYYGAADTTVCLATCAVNDLLKDILAPKRSSVVFLRSDANPILEPVPEHDWESRAVFNPATIYEGGKLHILYRAMSLDNTSTFGYASSSDGVHIDERLPGAVYVPREPFEMKSQSGNSGCEDPRITRVGDILYVCYTAFDGKNAPRVALTSITLEDFLAKKWNWATPKLISPPGLPDKDACVFPEKVNGRYLVFHRMKDSINIMFVPDLEFKEGTWLEENEWVRPRQDAWDSRKIGIASPPLKTKAGWLLLYHGVSDRDQRYRVGALLLDLKNPTKVLSRTPYPIFEPEASYEKDGEVPNVVFPCGAAILGKQLFIYYGGGDRVVGVATVELAKLLRSLKP